MAGQITQTVNGTTEPSGASSRTFALTGVASNSTLVLCAFGWKSGTNWAPAADGSEVTDDHSSDWIRADYYGGGTPAIAIWYVESVASGNYTVTLAPSGGGTWFVTGTLFELPDVTGAAFDQVSGAEPAGDSTPSVPSLTPASADSVYIGGCTPNSGVTDIVEPSGYTVTVEDFAANQDGQVVYKILSSTSAEAPTFTMTGDTNSSVIGAIFKTAAGGAADPEGRLKGGKLIRGGLLRGGVL